MLFDRRRPRRGPDINLAPMIDMIFILLIFFLVTTTFSQDRGLEIERPISTESQRIEGDSLRFLIAQSGNLYLNGEGIRLDEVGARVSDFLAGRNQGAVLIVPDAAVPAGRLVAVMNEAKRAGATTVAVATRDEGAR